MFLDICVGTTHLTPATPASVSDDRQAFPTLCRVVAERAADTWSLDDAALNGRTLGRYDRVHASYVVVLEAYATELLPAILGGEWRLVPYCPPPWGAVGQALFDNAEGFRRVGSRGRLSWSSVALIGQPHLARRGNGTREAWSYATAAELEEDHGVGVWARHDLSAWRPGWSTLVIAARGLRPEVAARFGFVDLRNTLDAGLAAYRESRRLGLRA